MVYVVRKYFGSLKPQHKMITTRQMKNFDEELFLDDLASVDWRSIVSDSGSLDDVSVDGLIRCQNFDEELFLDDLASVDWRSIVSDSGSLDDVSVDGLIRCLRSSTNMPPSGKSESQNGSAPG